MKVLLLAYECSPYHGSERAVGWGRLLQAARVAETYVLTSAACHDDLRRAEAEGMVPANVRLLTPRVAPALLARLVKRHGHFDYNYRAYRQWQRHALELAREQHAIHTFDVVHQATVCTFREPGFGWQLGLPLVWGPFGGTQNFPWRMLPLLPPRHALFEAARSVANTLTLRWSPQVRSAARHATIVLGANSANARDCNRVFGRPVERLLETAIADAPTPDRSRFRHRQALRERGETLPPLRLLWSGQLAPRKALPLLLRALATLREPAKSRGHIAFTLDVLGDGSERHRWQRMVCDLGLRDAVHFHGRLPLPEAVAAMSTADVLCFTSLRDTSGNVVLEALAAGVPVIAFDHQGAADMVSPDCGILIPVTAPPTAIRAWAEALRTLAEDPALLLHLSDGTQAQASQFLWQSNGDRINALYREAMESQPARDKRSPTAASPVAAGSLAAGSLAAGSLAASPANSTQRPAW